VLSNQRSLFQSIRPRREQYPPAPRHSQTPFASRTYPSTFARRWLDTKIVKASYLTYLIRIIVYCPAVSATSHTLPPFGLAATVDEVIALRRHRRRAPQAPAARSFSLKGHPPPTPLFFLIATPPHCHPHPQIPQFDLLTTLNKPVAIMVSLSQVFLRAIQFVFTLIITALVGNALDNIFTGSPASINYAMFAAAFSWIVLLYGLVAAFIESLAWPFVLIILDGLATLFTFVAAVVLAARLRVHSCTNVVSQVPTVAVSMRLTLL
jgi:hypothetical protein